jgi:hypothetical protein
MMCRPASDVAKMPWSIMNATCCGWCGSARTCDSKRTLTPIGPRSVGVCQIAPRSVETAKPAVDEYPSTYASYGAYRYGPAKRGLDGGAGEKRALLPCRAAVAGADDPA